MESLDLFGFLFAPQNLLFAIALGILGGLLLVEIVTLAAGIPFSARSTLLISICMAPTCMLRICMLRICMGPMFTGPITRRRPCRSRRRT